MRHFVDRGTLDSDGVRHSAKVAWRALALLQKEIEKERTAQKVEAILEFTQQYLGEPLAHAANRARRSTWWMASMKSP